jgi:hypothetical protein
VKRISTLALMLLMSHALAAATNPWTTPERFKQIEIPNDWIPAERATAIDQPKDFPRGAPLSVSIADFVRVYGTPSRLITPKSGIGTSFLIYDLQGGYKLYVWVGSLQSAWFQAAQVFRPDGRAAGLLLK